MVDSTRTRAVGEAETVLRDAGAGTELAPGAHVSAPGDIADPDGEIPKLSGGERYEAQKSLGMGGMGEVQLCRDLVIGREVALKAVLPKHAGRSEVRARFVREARVQGQLEHPAIVPVYDFGEDAEGRPYFTMKRIRGVTLERVLESIRTSDEAALRRYTPHKLLGAFVQVCLAIDFAHERGVLHRDLKPANVMLGDYGEVYVLDWGVAKVRSASRMLEAKPIVVMGTDFDHAPPSDVIPAAKSAPTAAGSVIGTPGYMPPEQLRGEELDVRADVYALGAILFELLTLEPLHGHGSVAAMMKRALEGADARASVRVPTREVAPELEAICIRACAKNPADRHASARSLADHIEAFLSGDRDVELRRALAQTHLDRARDAASRARVPNAPLAERTEALQEAGRAIALDPSHGGALELLVSTLTEPPATVPPEVLGAVDRARREAQRRMLPRVAAIYGGTALACFPLQYVTGVIDGGLNTAPLIVWLLLAVAVMGIHRYFDTAQRFLPLLVFGTSLAIGMSSVWFGPLILVPTLVLMSTMGTILITPRERRVNVVVGNLLALLLPIALAWLGHFPVAHMVEGDRVLRISMAAFKISRHGIFALLTTTYVLLLAGGAKYAALYRDALTAAETKNELQAWQLRQLVPAEASRAMSEKG